MKPSSRAETKLATYWVQALREAAGLLAAFTTPANLRLSQVAVVPTALDPNSAFKRKIQECLDLGAALLVAEVVPLIEEQLTQNYRHQIQYSTGTLRGQLSIPLYTLQLARGRPDILPTRIAARDLRTPENLFTSEAISWALDTVRGLTGAPGAEGVFARNVLGELSQLESRHPWADLRRVPRASLSELAGIVHGRLETGVMDPSHPIRELVQAFRGGQVSDAVAFEQGAGALALALSLDPEFANKLFELLCLAWISDGLKAFGLSLDLHPEAFWTPAVQPVIESTDTGGRVVRVYFQRSQALPKANWVDARSKRPLKAIPDIVVTLEDKGVRRIILIDAKRRPRANFSEVAYKMLGYQENLRISEYLGIALFPSTGNNSTLRRLRAASGGAKIWLWRLYLPGARAAVRRAIRVLLD